jgi:hypothetical protein
VSAGETRARLWDLLAGFMRTQAVSVAVRLGVPDVVGDEPRDVSDIAAGVGAHEQSLYRLLRALADEGVFAEIEPRRFVSTVLSDALRADAPLSMRPHALMLGAEHYGAWTDAEHSFVTGEPAFERLYGQPFFDYLSQHPEAESNFARAMASGAALRAEMLVGFDWSGLESVADIGGGDGTALAAVLSAQPHLRGTLFDLPGVVAGAPDVLRAAGVDARCAVVGGDFFEDPLPPADVYVLGQILHDWDDASAEAILRNCRRSIGGAGLLLLAEGILPEGPEPDFGKLFDLHMLVLVGGKERTLAEWRALLEQGGFELLPSSADGLLQARLV